MGLCSPATQQITRVRSNTCNAEVGSLHHSVPGRVRLQEGSRIHNGNHRVQPYLMSKATDGKTGETKNMRRRAKMKMGFGKA